MIDHMSSEVLYRKYRPKIFKEVLGQDAVISVLEGSIKKNSVAHAYIFSGSRGTGKTSVARIFARSLGCDDIDIYEVDAASYNSVEHIRDLNENIRTLPLSSKHKVYILDEIHMFSKSAFNAFLKTLEEPPAHAVFILVTTELEKIPDTIISRCQNFLFKKPSVTLLEEAVIDIAKKEKRSLDSSSASLIAFMSDGAYRDAYGFLQKIITATDEKKLTREIVGELLGAPTPLLVDDFIQAFYEGDIKRGGEITEYLNEHNMDSMLFIKLVLRKVRILLLIEMGAPDIADIHFSKEEKKILEKQAKKYHFTLDDLSLLLDASLAIPKSYIKSLPLEVAIIKKIEKNSV